MKRFVAEADRGQWTLLPECLDDFIAESNPVRVVDAFVAALDLVELGFDGVEPAATGRPAYHPSTLQLEESVARCLSQLDTIDLQEPSEELAIKTEYLKEKLAKLESEMQRLAAMEQLMLASPDQQISPTDPDSRSMATSGRGSGVVGYNVQARSIRSIT
jgi:hypothetical protein